MPYRVVLALLLSATCVSAQEVIDPANPVIVAEAAAAIAVTVAEAAQEPVIEEVVEEAAPAEDPEEEGVNAGDQRQLERKLRFVLREVRRLGELDEATHTQLVELGSGVIVLVLKDSPPVRNAWGEPPPRPIKPIFEHEEWKAGYEKLVPSEVRKAVDEQMKKRVKDQRRAVGRYLVQALDSQLLLTSEQRKFVAKVVEECALKGAAPTTHSLLREVVEEKLQFIGVLTDAQLKMFQAPGTSGRNHWQQGVKIPTVLGGKKMGDLEGAMVGPPATAPTVQAPMLLRGAVINARVLDAVVEAEPAEAVVAPVEKVVEAPAAEPKAEPAVTTEEKPTEEKPKDPPAKATEPKKDPKIGQSSLEGVFA